ncbi:hypothetical protein VTN77DRAFT_770 [Rasamsonia byssochlamydoides]|uniref:uncharacterized protein n=1 Tax=Rasamsonia byssochlamydoides TaxID=89139 RepID=UPI0037435025
MQFYLYIGQSINVKRQIEDHLNPYYRYKHPSLHYHVWGQRETMESKFVLLAHGTKVKTISNIELNIIELWCCLIFQTLPPSLLKYLPPDIPVVRDEYHLNIAHPLWQGFIENSMEILETKLNIWDFIQACSPEVAAYYRSLRKAWHELQYSKNPILREYYS